MTDPAAAQQTEQLAPPAPTPQPAPTVSANGPRQIFENITQALTDAELATPPVGKLLVYMLETAKSERDEYKKFDSLYHNANLNVGILNEKLKSDRANEITFGAGIGIGGAILGVSPAFYDHGNLLLGTICLVVAAGLIAGAIVARIKHG